MDIVAVRSRPKVDLGSVTISPIFPGSRQQSKLLSVTSSPIHSTPIFLKKVLPTVVATFVVTHAAEASLAVVSDLSTCNVPLTQIILFEFTRAAST